MVFLLYYKLYHHNYSQYHLLLIIIINYNYLNLDKNYHFFFPIFFDFQLLCFNILILVNL